jgi:hypothetical protein
MTHKPMSAAMKNSDTLMVRYTGTDENRRFVIQRGDFSYWTGEKWSKILDNAKVFNDHKSAQTTCSALQYQRYKGKPIRTFKVEVSLTLAADDVANITPQQLAEYLSKAMRLDVENSVFGDGPVDGSFVQARMKLTSLEETVPTRNKL